MKKILISKNKSRRSSSGLKRNRTSQQKENFGVNTRSTLKRKNIKLNLKNYFNRAFKRRINRRSTFNAKKVIENSKQKSNNKIVKRKKILIATRSVTKKIEEDNKKVIFADCRECKRPIELTKREANWKDLCMSCFIKSKGRVVNCSACKFEFLTLDEKSSELFCYDCTVAIHGGLKKTCSDCNKSFYQSRNSSIQKTLCYPCYLKNTSQKSNCITCGNNFFIKDENKEWKKKCYKCYIHDK